MVLKDLGRLGGSGLTFRTRVGVPLGLCRPLPKTHVNDCKDSEATSKQQDPKYRQYSTLRAWWV
jgi:hypothetical protein